MDRPIAISYCRGDMVHGDFAHALCMLSMRCVAHGMWIGHIVQNSSLICANRNYGVAEFLKGSASHLLMLDADMIFPADTLERLLAHPVDVVGASYSMRAEPRIMTHRDLEDSSELPPLGYYENNLYEIRRMGMGCVLIRREVLEALDASLPIESPFFQVEYRGRTAHTSEDNVFCDRIRAAGFSIYCDVDLSYKIRHIGLHRYSADEVTNVYRRGTIQYTGGMVNAFESPNRGVYTDTDIESPYPQPQKVIESPDYELTSDSQADANQTFSPVETLIPQAWLAHPHGGGATIDLGECSEFDACAKIAKDFGTTTHIDRDHKFIFFKPFGYNPGK